jgi:uncharacterized protein (TIGR03435 family)
VIDGTGLDGVYNYTLSWSPDENEIGPDGARVRPSPNRTGPSLLTALEEQLGLRLELKRVPLEVLVIDSVQTPTMK